MYDCKYSIIVLAADAARLEDLALGEASPREGQREHRRRRQGAGRQELLALLLQLLQTQDQVVAVVQHAADVHVADLEPVLLLANATLPVGAQASRVHLP